MFVTESDKLRVGLEEIASSYAYDRAALLPMLQLIQDKKSRISEYAMQICADILDIHPVEVYGVISFYSFLNIEPKGKFIVRMCRSISCDMAGKERVARQLRNDLGINFGETTSDGKFTLEWTNCLGMCDGGPAILVNDVSHVLVTPEKVHDILEQCRERFGVHAIEVQKEEI
jgi:[NiFe] hydrogenase diaphorase moiety large subunit